jgi:RimJ/RimL family protein N-acetyltransferase
VQQRFELEWSTPAGELRAFEPRLDEITPHAAALAAAYNDPRNATLLGHTSVLAVADVVDHYAALLETGRPFVLLRDGGLAGDGDLRGIANAAAEFAFLVADPDAQGRGLGTRFALMVHALAFRRLGIERVYASVVPHNVASRRVFEKLGYVHEPGAPYGDPGDITLALDRPVFERLHAQTVADIRIAVR